MPPATGTLKRTGLPINIVDLLEIDGGRWTITELAARFNADRANVSRAVHRLIADGRLEHAGVLDYHGGRSIEILVRFRSWDYAPPLEATG